MTRNICVAFVRLPHHHVQVQLLLFSDLPLISLIDPPSPNHLFLSFKAIFSLRSSCWIHQPATSSPGYSWHCYSVPLHSTHGWLLHGMFCFVLLFLVVLSSSPGYLWHCCSVPLHILHGWLLHVALCFVLYYFFLWFYYQRHIHLCYMMYLSKLSLPSNYSLGENNYYHWRISLSTIATSPGHWHFVVYTPLCSTWLIGCVCTTIIRSPHNRRWI